MVAARVVTDSRGPFANTRLANAGAEKGVKVGNPVMSENGLVGRVIGVTAGADALGARRHRLHPRGEVADEAGEHEAECRSAEGKPGGARHPMRRLRDDEAHPHSD